MVIRVIMVIWVIRFIRFIRVIRVISASLPLGSNTRRKNYQRY